MTTVAVPAIRGPLALAKTLSALDVLSGGRVIAGLGPGSSARDYAAVGLDFEERWPRLDEAVKALRSYFNPAVTPFTGRFYSTEDVTISPLPVQPGGIPIWIGSWGSDAGLRRVARLADGWLASAYNTTPAIFAEARSKLEDELTRRKRDASTFPNALATTVMYLTNDDKEATRVLAEVVAPALNRKPEEIGARILVCSPEEAIDRLSRYAEAGLQEVCLWPPLDEVAQLERFAADVAPKVPRPRE
jgi:alkanesulfonate monooxygenase SsuD/methylene tetrahydromethanopterin reductase-like flavin-dependent oxidoreductase (luciferase family)